MGRSLARLAVATGLLGLAIAAGGWWWLTTQPERLLQAFRERLAADYETERAMFMSVNRLLPHQKLVVAELDETVSGRLVSEKSWLGVDLGDTSLDYRVPVRFFYAVDLSGPAPIRIVVDVERRTLVARFPELQLLAAEPDLAKADKRVDVGWGRFSAYSGQYMLRQFDREILARAKQQAELQSSLLQVRQTARESLAAFVETYLVARRLWGEGAVERIEVRFADEAPDRRVPAVTFEAR